MVGRDLEAHREAVGGRQRGRALAGRYLDGLQHADGLARNRLLDDPGALDQEDERRRAAVHDRHLGPIEIDHDVVDAEARERRHQVFDGRDAKTVAVAEARAHLGGADVLVGRRHRRAANVGAPKPDARSRLGGMQDHAHRLAAVQTDAGALDRAAERFLSNYPRVNGLLAPLPAPAPVRRIRRSALSRHTLLDTPDREAFRPSSKFSRTTQFTFCNIMLPTYPRH